MLVLVVICVLTAGCGGTTDGANPTTTERPSPDVTGHTPSSPTAQVSATSEPTATPTPSPPPGSNTSAVSDVQTVLNAHYDVLRQHDYVVTYRYRGPDDLRDGEVADATHVNRSGTISSNHTANRQMIEKAKALPDGTVTNQTKYTEDTVTYYRHGAVDADGSPHDVYYTVTRWENTEFTDRHVTAIPLLTLTRYRLRAYDVFFESGLTRTNVSTTGNHTYHTYTPGRENETTGFVRIREDGFMKTIQLRTRIEQHTVTLRREYELGSKPVDSPGWKQVAILADRRRSGPSGDVDCDDFGTQAGAQSYHESTGGAGLDGDSDGRACEHLP